MARVRGIASAELPPDLAEILRNALRKGMARSATRSRCLPITGGDAPSNVDADGTAGSRTFPRMWRSPLSWSPS